MQEVSFSTQSQGKFPMFFVFYDVARNSYDAALVEYFQNYRYGQSKHIQVAMLLYRNLLHSLYISGNWKNFKCDMGDYQHIMHT